MAIVGFFHHIGTFLLLVATALLIVTDISAPVVNNIGLLKVDLGNATTDHHSALSFGTFGYCLVDAADGHDYCSKSQVGYRPLDVLHDVQGTDFSDATSATTRGLTRAMILHPIATGVCFIAFLLTLGAGIVGSFLAALAALFAFLITCAALVCDFVLFSIVKREVHDDDAGSKTRYSVAMWTILVAAVCTLLGAVVVFFTCCSARLHRQRHTSAPRHSKYAADSYGEPVAPRRRRRWF